MAAGAEGEPAVGGAAERPWRGRARWSPQARPTPRVELQADRHEAKCGRGTPKRRAENALRAKGRGDGRCSEQRNTKTKPLGTTVVSHHGQPWRVRRASEAREPREGKMGTTTMNHRTPTPLVAMVLWQRVDQDFQECGDTQNWHAAGNEHKKNCTCTQRNVSSKRNGASTNCFIPSRDQNEWLGARQSGACARELAAPCMWFRQREIVANLREQGQGRFVPDNFLHRLREVVNVPHNCLIRASSGSRGASAFKDSHFPETPTPSSRGTCRTS